MPTIGCLHVHACPASLRPAVDRLVAAQLPESGALQWETRHGDVSFVDHDWRAPAGTAALLAHALRGLGAVWFEVTERPTDDTDGERLSFVPDLGLYRAATNSAGDIVVDENQLAAALRDSPNAEALRERLARLLGRPWDDVLEPLRCRTSTRSLATATG